MKRSLVYLLGLIIFLENYDRYYCLRMKVIPHIRYFDETYMEDIQLQIRRNGRRTQYIANVNFTNNYYASNNVSLRFIFKELLSNEYRPSFVEMHFRLCDLILKDRFIGSVLRTAGITTCPLPPGKYYLKNLAFNQEFPSVWPFERGLCELIGKMEPSGKVIGRGDLTLTFKMIYESTTTTMTTSYQKKT